MHFDIYRKYCDSSSGELKRTILTYIILPSTFSMIRTSYLPSSSKYDSTISFLCSMIVDPSITKEPNAEEKGRFKKVRFILKLTPTLHELQMTAGRFTSSKFLPAKEKKQCTMGSHDGSGLIERGPQTTGQ